MQLIEIGIRSREQAKRLLCEIAQGRHIQTLKQPRIWRISREAAIRYMRANDISLASLVDCSGRKLRYSYIDLRRLSETN